MSIDCSYKSLSSPSSNELLLSHNSLTFKLLKTVADFSQALANLHDKFGQELQMVVETFRKRNGELRKESLFQIWELFLQQVEVNSQQHGDISRDFSQTIGNGLIERVFHRKIQSKKILSHRDRIETILLKSNELLMKCYNDYCQAYALAITNPAQYMSEYIASHNVYVHQLQATNGMIHAYQTKTLPKLLEELEECHLETSQSISSALLESSDHFRLKSGEQMIGYQAIANACRQANHRQDLAQFVKAAANELEQATPAANDSTTADDGVAPAGSSASGKLSAAARALAVRYHQFQAPSLAEFAGQFEPKNMQLVPTFKNEIAPDLSQPPAQQKPQLEKDREGLEAKIEKLEERAEALARSLARPGLSHNKLNELQDELSQRRFELHVAHIHLSAVRSQLQLFEYNYRPQHHHHPFQFHYAGSMVAAGLAGTAVDLLGGAQPPDDPLAPAASLQAPLAAAHDHQHHLQQQQSQQSQPPGYRNKWIKAFKSLKETPSSSSTPSGADSLGGQLAGAKFGDGDRSEAQVGGQREQQQREQQQQQQENQHFFQEYTFKKIASCDVCKDFLRGHMRQGVKCKLCKISCHNDCQSKAHATIKCQQPKIKLLRRQKSAGELEVNNGETGDGQQDSEQRSTSSKPDGIYQLIRQVLEAKKKGGQQQQQQQQQQDDYGQRLLMPGNLALANQNGKSVSTSALGQAAASVDRWAVVMDLLAESKKKSKDGLEAPDMGAKRHSKQLDKFKLAAKSAAAASKHQRQHLVQQLQQQQQQQSPQSPPQQPSPSDQQPPQHHHHHHHHHQQQQQQQDQVTQHHLRDQHHPQLQMNNSSPLNYQQQQQHMLPQPDHAYIGQPLVGVPMASDPHHHQQQQQQHLHHTKSLPVGQQQQQQPQLGGLVGEPLMGHLAGPSAVGPQLGLQQLQHPQQQQHPLQGGSMQQLPYQLLNISAQQLQSTSAPHSPQRKRFNLRMKSFSLDSPESPCVLEQHGGQHPLLPAAGHYGSGGAGPQYLDGQQQQVFVSHAPQTGDYHQQRYHDAQLSAYLSATQRAGGRHSTSGPQMGQAPGGYHQHRHSYHTSNPSYGYESGALEGPTGSASHLAAGADEKPTGASSGDNQHDYYDLGGGGGGGGALDVASQQQQQQQSSSASSSAAASPPTGTYVVLYDYAAQRADEVQLAAGQLAAVLDTSDRDWWELRALDGTNRTGYFPASYLAKLYQNERPLQVVQTIQVSNGETCDKLLRGQIVIHSGKQIDGFVTVRLVQGDDPHSANHYIQCPEKYLMEVGGVLCD